MYMNITMKTVKIVDRIYINSVVSSAVCGVGLSLDRASFFSTTSTQYNI